MEPTEAASAPPEGSHRDLPIALSTLVGREREIAEAKMLLAEGRLLTLTGTGGAGKTRLALAVSVEVDEAFEDGVWWVGLAPLSDPGLLPREVARAIGVPEAPDRAPAETLVERLHGKRALLILDNCEHLIEACASLADALLRACPDLRILATSREALGIAGERAYVVPPLSLPDPESPSEELARYEAVGLFVERARSAASAFGLTPENAEVVAEVCRRLEGVPLAIELAAAKTRLMSVGQILERLEDSLRVLAGTDRTAPERQRTLRGALDWSFELLGEQERVLFGRLSVFAGGWTLDAAEAVGSGSGIEEEDALDLLSGLVDKSMVVAEPREDSPRYRMLEPVRQYARECLEKSGEVEAVLRRHAGYFLALAEGAEPTGERQAEWLERLESEYGNLRAALSWSLGRGGDGELGLRLAGALDRFWWVGGHLSEGRSWLERGLEGGGTAPRVRAKALGEAGWMALYQNDLGRAVTLLEESVGLFEEMGDESGTAASLFNLGHAVLHQGNRERLGALCEKAETLLLRFVDRWAKAELLVLLGMAALYEGEHDRARVLLKQSRTSFREVGDTQRVTLCVTHLWIAELEGGDRRRAQALLEENLSLLQGLGIRPRIYNDLLGSAVLAALDGEALRAARLWGAAEALREAIGLAIGLWDHAPTDYEGLLAVARSRLGDAAWEAAWSEGREMTPDEAIEYALKTEDSVRSKDASGLSGRELEVLRLVAEGLTDAQVAQKLYLSPRTVGFHLRSVYRKLGVPSRAAAAREAARRTLI